MKDQETVVIGGLVRNRVAITATKIPLLGDIPVLGALFRSQELGDQKSNLILVLTPYIIREQSDLRTVFERKMQERQEFLDHYFVFSEQQDRSRSRVLRRAFARPAGGPGFRRHVDDEVAADLRLAAEPPAGRQRAALVGVAVLDRAPGTRVVGPGVERVLGERALGDVDLAAAADPAAAADEIEIDAEPPRRLEQARPVGEVAALAGRGEDDATVG